MNRGNPNYLESRQLSSKPASVIYKIPTSLKEDVPSPNARRHLQDEEFTSHRSASPKSPELKPAISQESRVNKAVLLTPRVLKVNRPTWNSSELRKNQITAMTKEGGKLVSPRVLEATPYPIWDISQLPEDKRLEIIKKRDALLNKKKKSVMTILDLQASSGSSILNSTMHQETDATEVSRREETQPHDKSDLVTVNLVYGPTELIPEKLPPAGAGVLLRPEGAQVQKEKQSCFSGCIIS